MLMEKNDQRLSQNITSLAEISWYWWMRSVLTYIINIYQSTEDKSF